MLLSLDTVTCSRPGPQLVALLRESPCMRSDRWGTCLQGLGQLDFVLQA